jgi:hypothetical protein
VFRLRDSLHPPDSRLSGLQFRLDFHASTFWTISGAASKCLLQESTRKVSLSLFEFAFFFPLSRIARHSSCGMELLLSIYFHSPRPRAFLLSDTPPQKENHPQIPFMADISDRMDSQI